MRRVVVTGIGLVCSCGHSVEETWDNLIAGRSGIGSIEQFDASDLPVQIAGEVKNFRLSEDILSVKEQSRLDLFTLFALHSAHEAMEKAKMGDNLGGYSPDRVGSVLGIGMGGFPSLELNYKQLFERGPRRVSPFFIPGTIPNMAPGMISIIKGFKGINYSVSSACASSGHAIGNAALEIRSGRQDVMITGGAEAVIVKITTAGFANMKATSRQNETPQEASRPFDLKRDGFVMGEGAGILILEEMEKAMKRGAPVYAELVGDAYSSDAYHITAPLPGGEGASLCMQKALDSANLRPEQIDYINAHGTSTPLGDKGETLAIKRTFKEHAHKLYISSTKSMTGHLLGAAGGLESIVCVMALKTGKIPPTINYHNPDPECDLNYVPNKAVSADIQYALNNSFGFGGTNSSLIFKKLS